MKKNKKHKNIDIQKHEVIYKMCLQNTFGESHWNEISYFVNLGAMFRYLSHYIIHSNFKFHIVWLKKKTNKYIALQKTNPFLDIYLSDNVKYSIIPFPLIKFKLAHEKYKIIDKEAEDIILKRND